MFIGYRKDINVIFTKVIVKSHIILLFIFIFTYFIIKGRVFTNNETTYPIKCIIQF